MYTAAVITVSDRSYRGEREDKGGPAVKEMLEKLGYEVVPWRLFRMRKKNIRGAHKGGLKGYSAYCHDGRNRICPEGRNTRGNAGGLRNWCPVYQKQ